MRWRMLVRAARGSDNSHPLHHASQRTALLTVHLGGLYAIIGCMARLIPPVVEAGALASQQQPEISIDDDLTLRPWRHGDARTLIEAFSASDIQHYHFRRFDNEPEAQKWIDDCAEGWRAEKSATWAIVDRPADKIVGRVTVYTSLADGLGEISYWVVPDARGRGIATRSCVAAMRWGHHLGLHRIQLEHSTQNEASRRVALRAGFVEEGTRRAANLHADGWHDMVLYSHLITDGDLRSNS